MAESILVLNAGSSSIKFQLFEVGDGDRLRRRLRGQLEGVGTRPCLTANIHEEGMFNTGWPAPEVPDLPSALDRLAAFLRNHLDGRMPTVVGHRVVHGGPYYCAPTIVSEGVLDRLDRLVPLAPLHQPHNLAPIRTILARHPQILQVACFDTAFHRGHPEVADRFAIPDYLYCEGVRRYGFHGLSYEYIARKLGEVAPELARGRVIVAHLGNGASMCALRAGKSVESTMGFTALDGLPMGTRSGQLDPGVVLYLMSAKGMGAHEIERQLYKECGLKGLSGVSSDMRELLASKDPRAKLAVDYFTYRIALSAGMLAAALGGLDAFVFTGGIGENAAAIREAVGQRLCWLGLEISSRANAKGEMTISRKGSKVTCLVLSTDEELMIATHALRALRHASTAQLQEQHA